MFQDKCVFCKGKDITEVVPGLEVDLGSAIETGIVQDTSALAFHNMMKDLAEVGQVARDQFDIIEYEHSYAKFRKHVNDKEKEKSESK